MIFLLSLFLSHAFAFDCHYEYTVWNTRTRASEGPFKIKKWKKDLTKVEKGPLGCSLCEEDQVNVQLKDGKSFRVCSSIADTFKQAIDSSGFKVETILGYRPSRSRGPVDSRGLRTEFSNHAYGVAVDINENYNGLYSNCVQWGTQCVLTKGGTYRPTQDARSLTRENPLTLSLIHAGLRWGGEIEGTQKDFMHFSPDGY